MDVDEQTFQDPEPLVDPVPRALGRYLYFRRQILCERLRGKRQREDTRPLIRLETSLVASSEGRSLEGSTYHRENKHY